MGQSLDRTAANTVFTWLTAANNIANMKSYDTTFISTIPNTNSAGVLSEATHHQLKFLYRANAWYGVTLARFTF